MTLAFVSNLLDRCANQRSDPSWVAAQRGMPAAKVIQLVGDATWVDGGQLVTDRHLAPAAAPTVFLGIDAQGAPWFAYEGVAPNPPEAKTALRELRGLALAGIVPAEQLGILAQARSLLQWHSRHRFCSACGAATLITEAGNRRHCPACEVDHFPRTDPVAIMVVRHQGRVLLGRQKTWPAGMYSALAGFLEPGETLEDAARREVFEEAGVRVGAVSYLGSQPWPFPSSLMLGLIGDALSSEIVIDHKELEDARWFDAEEARMMVERRHPQGLFAANPMALAHQLVRAALGLALIDR
jgi:NAD+ diphosphatase